MAAPLLPPTQAVLREVALDHLARYSTSRARLLRILDRRIDRWVRQQAEPDPAAEQTARAVARGVVAALESDGLVDDAAFAETRALRLVRAGRSRVAIAAHLAARGVAMADTQAALPDDPQMELAAALVVARRRRIGPFREGAADPDSRRRELAVLARAGFPQELASRALQMNENDAEALILRLRRE